ncbi:hypothetical protein GC175_26340 [bacterium]|nr:hypothetical protein [bacterium]
MRRNRVVINWQMITEDADWEQVQHPPPEPSVPDSPQTRRRRIVLAASLAVVLVVGVYFLWRLAQSGLEQIAADLEETFTLESCTTPAAPAQVQVDLAEFEPQGELVIADVVVHDPTQPLPYRETRCYVRTEDGLERGQLLPVYWGEQHQLESDYFSFRFYHRDADAVAQAVPKIDALYDRLSRLLALDQTCSPQRMTVDVLSEMPATPLVFAGNGGQILQIASPALMMIPISMDDADYLVQAVTVPLVRLLVFDLMDDVQASQRWRPLVEALRLWLFWESDGPLSVWREDVIPWLYDGAGTCAALASGPPEAYRQFCQSLTGFNLHPLDLSIPLPCDNAVATGEVGLYIFSANWPLALTELAAPLSCTWSVDPNRLYCLFPPNIPTRLAEFTPPTSGTYSEAAEIRRLLNYRAQVVAITTILDYATAEYGAATLVDLVHALGLYEDWESLIPAVYGVDTTTFEAGWQEYVKVHYGVDGGVGVEFFDALARFETEVTVSYGIYRGE